MNSGLYIVLAVIFLIVRIALKVSKNNTSSNYKRTPPPPPPNMKQPPPYIPPAGQNPYQQPEYNPFSADIFKGTNVYSNPNNTSTPPPFTGNSGQDDFSSILKPPSSKSNMSQGNDAYYCKYCGKKFQSVASLKMDTCFKHPKADSGLQKHELYTGAGRPNVGF